jgi:LysR family transcriptional activator of nhaA
MSHDVRPTIVAEFDDSALAKSFGVEGMGVFATPTVIESEVLHQSGVRVIGRSEEVRHQFYALSVERKIKHPAVVAICKSARSDIFGQR